jgi:predicted metal-dependent HD superfamily phosphohydrolase
MAEQNEIISEQLKNSIFACNGDFIEYRRENDGAAPSSLLRPLSTYDYLLSHWKEAVKHLNCSSKQEENDTFFKDWFHRLWKLHTTYKTRHYHTVVHLEEMCYYLQFIYGAQPQHEKSGIETDPRISAILLSIFFHDAIYDPQSNKNEEDSAALFEEFADGTDMNSNQKQDVVAFILATKHHTVDEEDIVQSTLPGAIFDHPMLLFLDLDMAVLGKEARAYQQYAALIRREYAFVPLPTYCEKRADILEAFLQQERIFQTSIFRNAFECRARLNLQREIQLLREGKIPMIGDDSG